MNVQNKNEIYKCEVCGNIVGILTVGGGELICCQKPMLLQKENSIDTTTEKHIPIIERIDDKIIITVGEISHPMEDAHYIKWIEIIADKKVYRQNLKPSDKPKIEFYLSAKNITARAYCNLHGLWKSKTITN